MLKELLREAGPGNVICLPSGIHTGGVVLRDDTSIVASGSAVIQGHGDSALVISGAPRVVLRGVILRGGAAYAGGGIYAPGEADILVEDSIIAGNHGLGFGGGGIYLGGGRLTLRRCCLLANDAPIGGAVLVDGAGRVRAEGCAFIGNKGRLGTGLCALDGATVELIQCTLRGQGSEPLLYGRGTSSRQPIVNVVHSVLDATRPLGAEPAPLSPRIRVVRSLLAGSLTHCDGLEVNEALEAGAVYIDDDPCRGLAPESPGTRRVRSDDELGEVTDLLGRIVTDGDDLGAVARALGPAAG